MYKTKELNVSYFKLNNSLISWIRVCVYCRYIYVGENVGFKPAGCTHTCVDNRWRVYTHDALKEYRTSKSASTEGRGTGAKRTMREKRKW